MVASGATNREAAASLFLSPKTIEFHLHNIYGKLGIRSRADLARVVASVADGRSALDGAKEVERTGNEPMTLQS